MICISVIICCYNSESRIVTTLSHLSGQETSSGVDWEVILVDNNCTDRTTEVARENWNREDIPLRIVEERTPGLSAARDCGVAHACGDYVLFCDDDNWLASDYLEKAFQFLSANPEYTAIGGWGDVVSDPDVTIPDWFEQFKTKYACGQTRLEGDVGTLVGAGLCVRKRALTDLKLSGFKSLLSDRKGAELTSGGDLELSTVLRSKGGKLYFSESMCFKHYMPAERLTEDYLLRMCRGHGRSRPILSEYFLMRNPTLVRRIYGRLFPIRLLLRRVLKFNTPRVPERASLADKVQAASDNGAVDTEYQLLRSGRSFLVCRRILRNANIKMGWGHNNEK
jgi:glycosyltransferase involved in cell wall biosynthesis